MQVVKEVVIKINELNIEYDYFIETMEREDSMNLSMQQHE